MKDGLTRWNGAKWHRMAGDNTVNKSINARIERLERTANGGYMPILVQDNGDGTFTRLESIHKGEILTRKQLDACEWTVIIIDV